MAREAQVMDGVSFSYRVGWGQMFGVNFARSNRALTRFSDAAEFRMQSYTQAWMQRYFEHHDVCRNIELTEAQQRVLRHLLRADGNKAIADALGITVSGVKHHIQAIGRKLPTPTSNRSAIPLQAVRIGLAAKYGFQ